MASTTDKHDARLNFRLRSDLKQTTEQAAAELGQSVSEFAVSTLVRQAQEVIQQSQQTRLSNRDRERFLEALDDVDARHPQAKAASSEVRRLTGCFTA